MASIETHTHTEAHTNTLTHSHKCAHTHKDYSQKSRQIAYKDRTGWMVKCSLSFYALFSCLYVLLLNPIKKNEQNSNNNKKPTKRKMSQLLG